MEIILLVVIAAIAGGAYWFVKTNKEKEAEALLREQRVKREREDLGSRPINRIPIPARM